MANRLTEEQEEAAYIRGERAALTRILSECLRDLDADDTLRKAAGYIREHEEAIAMLREVCAEHGDNDWPDNLWLPDIIEKHLWRHVERLRSALAVYADENNWEDGIWNGELEGPDVARRELAEGGMR